VAVEKFPQNMSTFAAPTKRFGELVCGKRLRHDGNPAARWMADNCLVVNNGTHAMPSRRKSKNKIDGIVAAVMALGGAVSAPAESGAISSRLLVV
jgi:phage terminase large subunit-like protein